MTGDKILLLILMTADNTITIIINKIIILTPLLQYDWWIQYP